MATDIAFALAILAVVAPGLPPSLRAFLLTLAIVDDLGSILVIATVFTAQRLLRLARRRRAAVCVVWWLLQRRHVRGWFLYAAARAGLLVVRARERRARDRSPASRSGC